MKKYLALALLTCAGVTFLHAGEASANPTPAEAFKLSLVQSKRAARRQQQQPSPASKQAIETIASDRGVSPDAIANAAFALVAAQADDKAEFVAIAMPENLSTTQLISKEAKQKLQEADLADRQLAEANRKKEEAVKALEKSFLEIKDRRDVTASTAETKKQKSKEINEEAHAKKIEAEAKKDLAQKYADALVAARQAARVAIEQAETQASTSATEAEAAALASAEKQRNALSRENSCNRDLHKLASLDSELEEVTTRLAGYGRKTSDLIQDKDLTLITKPTDSTSATDAALNSGLYAYFVSFLPK